jgi:hypothetical protein
MEAEDSRVRETTETRLPMTTTTTGATAKSERRTLDQTDQINFAIVDSRRDRRQVHLCKV